MSPGRRPCAVGGTYGEQAVAGLLSPSGRDRSLRCRPGPRLAPTSGLLTASAPVVRSHPSPLRCRQISCAGCQPGSIKSREDGVQAGLYCPTDGSQLGVENLLGRSRRLNHVDGEQPCSGADTQCRCRQRSRGSRQIKLDGIGVFSTLFRAVGRLSVRWAAESVGTKTGHQVGTNQCRQLAKAGSETAGIGGQRRAPNINTRRRAGVAWSGRGAGARREQSRTPLGRASQVGRARSSRADQCRSPEESNIFVPVGDR